MIFLKIMQDTKKKKKLRVACPDFGHPAKTLPNINFAGEK